MKNYKIQKCCANCVHKDFLEFNFCNFNIPTPKKHEFPSRDQIEHNKITLWGICDNYSKND